MGRIVSIYVSSNVGSFYTGQYIEQPSQSFDIENGDLFVWQNFIVQVADIWSRVYDGTESNMNEPCKCVIRNILPQTQIFHHDSGIQVGKELNFPIEFIAVAVGRRYVPPPPEPPPPPPPPDTDKFNMMAS